MSDKEESGLKDPKLTDTQEKIDQLNLFLKNVSQPIKSYSSRIKEWDDGFKKSLRIDSATSSKDAFITSFLSLVQSSLSNNNVTIDDLNKIYDLFFKFKESTFFSDSQKKRFSTAVAQDILSRKNKQNQFRDRIKEAIPFDFDAKLSRYMDLFSTNYLDGTIVDSNIQELVNAVGNLANFIAAKTPKETKSRRDKYIKFCNDIKNNQYLSDDQKKQIEGYIKIEQEKDSPKKPAGKKAKK